MRIKNIFLFFLFLFCISNVNYIKSDTLKKSLNENITKPTGHDIRIGERLFYGQIPSTTKSINCASCHATGHIDTLNWSPSAMDIAAKFSKKDFVSFKKAITQPSGKIMSQIHDSLQFNDTQIRQIWSFLAEINKKEVTHDKRLLTNRLIFIILIFIFLLTFLDFAIFGLIKYKIIHALLLLICAVFITNYIVTSAINIGRSQNYQPDQPIKFSHKIHAGQNQTACVYCHFTAEQSKIAGIPPASVCLNCHVIVKEGSRSGKFEIDKISQAIDENRPIEWVKVHNLPDHVFFSHAQHVSAGKIECITCHGDVTKMDQIIQVKDLSMGWCINCHRETKVQFDNKFYGKYAELHKELKEGKISKVTAEKIGGTDCMKCHY